MTERLKSQIEDGCRSSDVASMIRWEALRADLTHYVCNGRVSSGLMKWLEPKKAEIWTLRSVRPRPSLRVFGRFAQRDVFVGTHAKERDGLGGKWSLAWELEKLECEEEWNRVFPGSSPMSRDTYEEYFGDNAQRRLRI